MAKRGAIQKIADACGVDHKTVRNALDAEGIDVESNDYRFDDAVAAVKAIADPARVAGHAATRVAGSAALRDVRMRFTELKTQQLEIENQKAIGALVPREAVTETGKRIIAGVRVSVLSLGDRVADRIAGKTDAREIARIIVDEARVVLGELADPATFFLALETEALS